MHRRKKLDIRLTELEKLYIKKQAEKAGITPSEFVRRSAFSQEVKERISDQELEALKDLRRIARALQSLNNYFKDKDWFKMQDENRAMIEELKKFILKW